MFGLNVKIGSALSHYKGYKYNRNNFIRSQTTLNQEQNSFRQNSKNIYDTGYVLVPKSIEYKHKESGCPWRALCVKVKYPGHSIFHINGKASASMIGLSSIVCSLILTLFEMPHLI